MHNVGRHVFHSSTTRLFANITNNSSKLPRVVLLAAPQRRKYSHKEIWGDDFQYKTYYRREVEVREQYYNCSSRFQSIAERQDRSELTRPAIEAQCKGKYFITHRGFDVMKTADDMVVMQQVLWHLKPRTVIELGTFCGGSGFWLADMLSLMKVPSNVYSMDIDLSNIQPGIMEQKSDSLTFLQGDCNEIEKTFTPEFLMSLPHPWLVIEDSHTNVYNVLKYFNGFMQKGDYFIVEDLNPDLPSCFGYGRIYPENEYEAAGPVGLNILKKFLEDFTDELPVDSYYTDFFGYNGTWNWHGYIRRMK